MKTIRAGALLTMLFILGCGGPMIFKKDGAGAEELKRASYECKVQWEQSSAAHSVRNNTDLVALSQARGMLQECLEYKGWKRVE